MKATSRFSLRLLSFVAAASLAGVSYAAEGPSQEPSAPQGQPEAAKPEAPPRGIGPEVKPEDLRPDNPFEPVVQDETQQKMIELFGKVERRLVEIDRLLSDASAGDTTKLKNVGESGIDKLLDLSRRQGQQAVKDIDEILVLAEQMQQQCQSPGSSSQCDKPGSTGSSGKASPIDKAGSQTTQRERTPEAPPEMAQKEGQQPKDGGEKPSDEPQDGQPKSPLASQDDSPQNTPGQNPASTETELARGIDDLDRWGDLPLHARDVFRTEGGGDLPARYRDWIESYYRRLNEQR